MEGHSESGLSKVGRWAGREIEEAQSFVIMIECGVRRSNQNRERSKWRGRNTGELKNSDGDLHFKSQEAEYLYIRAHWKKDHEWSFEGNGSRSMCTQGPENEGKGGPKGMRRRGGRWDTPLIE